MRKYRFPENSTNPNFYLSVSHRQGWFIENTHRVLAVLLDAKGKLPAFDLFQLPAHQVEKHHRLGSVHLGRCRASPFTESRRLRATMLFACLHHPHKATDSVDLLSVCSAKLPEARQQFFGGFSFGLDLLLDLLEESIQFGIDLKKGAVFTY
jgi:hypothetical protein